MCTQTIKSHKTQMNSINTIKNILHKIRIGDKEKRIYLIAAQAKKATIVLESIEFRERKQEKAKTVSKIQREIYNKKYLTTQKFFID